MTSMNPPHDRLLREVLTLPAEVRAALAGALLASLDEQPDPGAEAEWEGEITRRIRALDEGSISLVSWAEARRAVHGAA